MSKMLCERTKSVSRLHGTYNYTRLIRLWNSSTLFCSVFSDLDRFEKLQKNCKFLWPAFAQSSRSTFSIFECSHPQDNESRLCEYFWYCIIPLTPLLFRLICSCEKYLKNIYEKNVEKIKALIEDANCCILYRNAKWLSIFTHNRIIFDEMKCDEFNY